MSQVFSADSVNLPAIISLPPAVETPAVVGNFLNPPFQNAKAIVFATINITTGTGTTGINVRIRRNPNAENSQVGGGLLFPAGSAVNVTFAVSCADTIPDGRPVQYSVTAIAGGASAAGSVVGANISAILISG